MSTYAVIRMPTNLVIKAEHVESFIAMITANEVTGGYDWGAVSSGRLKIENRKSDFEELSISIVTYKPEDKDKDRIKMLESEISSYKSSADYYRKEHEKTSKREKDLQDSFNSLQEKFERLAESVRPCNYKDNPRDAEELL